MYKLVLFDIDDTLLDFKRSERVAFFETLQAFEIVNGQTAIFNRYQEVGHHLWKSFEKGIITKEFLRLERFNKIVQEFSLNVSVDKMSKCYLEALVTHTFKVKDAQEILQNCKENDCKIGVISNGFKEVQKRRLENADLLQYIDFVVTSDEIGIQKPDIEIFKYAIKKYSPKIKKENILMIGDRIESDIKGGNDFGIDTCWLNNTGQLTHENEVVHPTVIVKNLRDLKNIVMPKEM